MTAAEIAAILSPMGDIPEPHVVSYRRARGLPELPMALQPLKIGNKDHPRRLENPALSRSCRLLDAGYRDVHNGIAHVVLAARVTSGLAAPHVARIWLFDWVDALDDDALDRLADELIAEAERRQALRTAA